jgi:dTDP-4-dehydrorhamnose reductase
MTILITGANGFLGQYLCTNLASKGFRVVATSRGDCRIFNRQSIKYQSVDVTNKVEVATILALEKPDIVIHNAAMSKPDACEKDGRECMIQNVDTTMILLEACKKIKPFFIYISTDFVFGENGPHSEDAAPDPLNLYGISKLLAEQMVQSSGLTYAIVRPVFIYGQLLPGMKPTFIHWVQQNLENGKRINVVNDQQRTPTFVTDICDGIFALINKKAQGVFHLAGKDILSPNAMAVTVAAVLGLDASLIEPVTSATFIEPVQRAKKSGLKINKAIEILDYNPVSFEEGVKLSFGIKKLPQSH